MVIGASWYILRKRVSKISERASQVLLEHITLLSLARKATRGYVVGVLLTSFGRERRRELWMVVEGALLCVYRQHESDSE